VASSCRSASPLGSSKNASESKVKIVDVLRNDTKGFEVGQQVVVWASKDVANQALLLGFGVPFLLLVCVLMIALKLTDSEGVSALAAIASLVPYYVALWLMRDRIQQRISFNLED
jgi:sigma-E factor negative regulatory protein RseC